MHARSPEKSQANHSPVEEKSRSGLSIHNASSAFSDNRPEATAQKNLSALVGASEQVLKAQQFQMMADRGQEQIHTEPLQRKVAVAKSNKEEENDWVILTNLVFAKTLAGGTVTDFGGASDFSDMRENENLAIVGHGSPGSIQGFTAEDIFASLTKKDKAMPKLTAKLILLSCNAAALTDPGDKNSSLVSKLAMLLGDAGYATIVEGKVGLTQVSPRTGINATKPSKKAEHIAIEKQLINEAELNFTKTPVKLRPERRLWLQQYNQRFLDPNDVDELKAFLVKYNVRKFASEILEENGVDPDPLSLEQRADIVAEITGPFYVKLQKAASDAGTLFESGASTGSGTVLAYNSEILEL